MRLKLQHLLGSALCTTAMLAQADTPAASWADMSQIRVQLTDLNTTDGIAPSVTARAGGQIWSAVQTDVFVPALSAHDEMKLSVSYFPALPVSADSVTLVSSPVSGTAQRTADTLYTRVTGASALMTESYAWWEVRANYVNAPDGRQLVTGSFDLSPYTAITLTADYSVFATLAAGADGFASSSAQLRGVLGTASYDQFTVDNQYVGLSAPGQQASSGVLSITLTNNTATATPVYFQAFAMSYVSVSSVPEPGMWALMLGGMAVLGMRRRHLVRR